MPEVKQTEVTLMAPTKDYPAVGVMSIFLDTQKNKLLAGMVKNREVEHQTLVGGTPLVTTPKVDGKDGFDVWVFLGFVPGVHYDSQVYFKAPEDGDEVIKRVATVKVQCEDHETPRIPKNAQSFPPNTNFYSVFPGSDKDGMIVDDNQWINRRGFTSVTEKLTFENSDTICVPESAVGLKFAINTLTEKD